MAGEVKAVVLPEEFDVNKVQFTSVKTLNNGSKAVYVNYDGMRDFYIQTPKMRAPFGVRLWDGDNGAAAKYDLAVAFDRMEQQKSIKAFHDALKAMDEKLVKAAMDNSVAWFRKKFATTETVVNMLAPSVKPCRDKETNELSDKFSPTFKMTLPHKDGRFTFPAYGARGVELDLMRLLTEDAGRYKDANVRAIVKPSSVWMSPIGFGVTWKVEQLMLTERPRLSKFAFQPTSDDDEEDMAPDADADAAAEGDGGADADRAAQQLDALAVKDDAAPAANGLLPESDGEDPLDA